VVAGVAALLVWQPKLHPVFLLLGGGAVFLAAGAVME